MSEADKIIKSLRDSGKKVEEFYMSNKTSDKNVANVEVIEGFIIELKDFGLNKDTLEVVNELENLLAEREQDKKRIKELEEERNHWHGCFIVAMENSIAKEKVINVIQEYKDKIERYKEYRIQGKETDVEYYENIANTIIVQVLQELLGGESE